MIVLRALSAGLADGLRASVLGLALAGIGLTLLLFAGLQAAIFWLIRLLAPDSLTLPLIGTIDPGGFLAWGSLALFPVMSIFLMAPVAAGFAGLFAERVAGAVEAIHYPQAQGQSLDFWDGVLESLAVMAAMIGVAILTLILTPFLGPLAPLLFYGANGWLLGREFFQMAARRHLPEAQAQALHRGHSGRILAAGVLIAIALTVPVVNIMVPLLAAAAFTHLFHLIARETDQRIR